MKISIITVGKIKDRNIENLLEHLKKRLKPHAMIKEIHVKSEKFSPETVEKARKLEWQKIEKRLKEFKKDSIFLLSEEGREFNSKHFSEFLSNNSEPVFVVAGPLGWPREVKTSDYQKISLSKMTFPHELASLLLYEQIYRSMTILINKKYHY